MPVTRHHSRGFTLVELLVALFVMALLALLSWRGLDGMTQAQSQTAGHADEVLALQVGLDQWAADLDALEQLPARAAIDWNGRVLRLTRRGSASPTDGLRVVGWTRRLVGDQGVWLRWQSPPLTTRGELDQAWQRADIWSQNPGDEERKGEVAVTPLAEWQIFYYRSDAWSNPMSSDATVSSGPGMNPPGTPAPATAPTIPDGVRLVLTLPPGQALAGKLTRDWVRPTVGGGKS